MKNSRNIYSTYLLTTLFALLVLSAGCNNPASNDEEHSDPHGIQFVMNGEVILTFFDGTADGQFQVTENDETSLITAEFLDENGEEIHGEDFDSDFSLNWVVQDTNITEVEQHDEDGRWSFHLVGKSAGTSTIQFMLMHGNHPDFETPDVDNENAIEVQVEAAAQ